MTTTIRRRSRRRRLRRPRRRHRVLVPTALSRSSGRTAAASSARRSRCPRIGRTPLSAPSSSPSAAGRADGDRIGSLLANPGGPGAPGIPIVEDAEAYFTEELLDRFDIVAWDPRGAGESTAIDCGDELDYFFATDKSPDDEARGRRRTSRRRASFADDCETRSGDLLPHLSSSATVDDMDAIRAALGEEKLTYLGFSYGTYLGALYADRYPHARARARARRCGRSRRSAFEDVTREQADRLRQRAATRSSTTARAPTAASAAAIRTAPTTA